MEDETFEEISIVELLKQTRVNIDANIKTVESLMQDQNFKPAIRELSLARTKLQEAKMWVGVAVGELGSKLPKEFRDEADLEAMTVKNNN